MWALQMEQKENIGKLTPHPHPKGNEEEQEVKKL